MDKAELQKELAMPQDEWLKSKLADYLPVLDKAVKDESWELAAGAAFEILHIARELEKRDG